MVAWGHDGGTWGPPQYKQHQNCHNGTGEPRAAKGGLGAWAQAGSSNGCASCQYGERGGTRMREGVLHCCSHPAGWEPPPPIHYRGTQHWGPRCSATHGGPQQQDSHAGSGASEDRATVRADGRQKAAHATTESVPQDQGDQTPIEGGAKATAPGTGVVMRPGAADRQGSRGQLTR